MKTDKIVYIFLFCCLFAANAFSFDVRIGIRSGSGLSKIAFRAEVGHYMIFSGASVVAEVSERGLVQVHIDGDYLKLLSGGDMIGTFASLKFKSADSINYFSIAYPSSSARNYPYENALEIYPGNGVLKLINVVELDKYVAGVVESEIGHIKNPELLKVQSSISRTYAIGHLDRHKAEGFNLCDETHCQVYHGKSRFNPNIIPSVLATTGLIVTDQAFQPIQAAFHSNCGGETCNSEDVWSKPVPYLRSIKDTFCTAQPHASWEKKLSLKQWESYLSGKLNQRIDKPCIVPYAESRKVKLDCYPVALKDIRADLNLNSTFFSMSRNGSELTLRGRGFGHGVGMCQEGAIKMAELGYKFNEIIQFYYTGVQIIDVSSWNLIDN